MNFNENGEIKLGDVADILSGYAFKSSDFVNEGIPIIKIKNIVPPIIDISDVQYVSQELYNEKSRYSLKYNDILISLTGSNVNQIASAVGKIGRVRLKNTKLLLNQRVGKLYVTDEDRCDYNYLYYYLIQEDVRYNLAASAGGSANQANISPSQIKNIKIKLPTLEEQKAISNILRTVDEKIEINNQINSRLEEMAQTIFKQWFVDFEFPNEDGEPYKSSGGEMVESEVGVIPKGWEVKKIEELCEIITKSEKPFENPEKIYEHFSLPACDEGKLPVIEPGKNISSSKYKINSDCILISKLNPSTKRIWDPLCNSENAICSTEFIAFKPRNKAIKPFCYEIINSDKFSEFLLANVTGSTGSRQRVQPKNTLNFKFAVGETKIIEDFCSVIKPIHQKIKVNIQESKVLRDSREALLPKLVSGEIRVPLELSEN